MEHEEEQDEDREPAEVEEGLEEEPLAAAPEEGYDGEIDPSTYDDVDRRTRVREIPRPPTIDFYLNL